MPARKPRPDLITRTEAEAMIAAAIIAAERGRREASKPLGLRSHPTFRKK